MRSLFIAIGIVIAILLISGAFLYYNSAWVLSYMLSSQFGTRVHVEKVAFLSEEVQIRDLSIANPKGTTSEHALEAEYIDVKAPYGNYFHQTIEIDEIFVDNLLMVVETYGEGKDKKMNWTVLTDSLQEDTIGEKASKKVGRSAVIKELIIQNITIKVVAPGKKDQMAKISSLKFKDIKTKDGELTKRITEAIVYRLIFNIKNIVDIPFNAAKDSLDGFFHTIDKLFPSFIPSKKDSEEAKEKNAN